jgi:hypothetical protein
MRDIPAGEIVRWADVVMSDSEAVTARQEMERRFAVERGRMRITPATAFEGKTARGNLGWWWLRVRGRHGP